jgi:ATP-dependent Clp protease ATP-binding subunit ClpC
MFERFTDQARRVVVLAQEEARELGHDYIGTEHLLLGLIREKDGAAARALDSLGIHLAAARQQVTEIIGPGQGQPAGHIPFTPRAKKVLELSLREAQHLGDDCIGTEHLLLGLIREGEGVAAQVLVRLGPGLDEARRRVTQIVLAGPREARAGPGSPAARSFSRNPVERVSDRLAEVLRRLDEISERLAAIENRLAGPERGQRDSGRG